MLTQAEAIQDRTQMLISYNHLMQPTLGNDGITAYINQTIAKYSKLQKLKTPSSTLPNIKAHFQTQWYGS